MKKITGRRVRVIKKEDSLQAIGKIGRVIYDDGHGVICIRIVGWDQGHGGPKDDDLNECWYFNRGAVKLLPRRKR